MPDPSILRDGSRFFVNVLMSEVFKKRGLLTKSEGRVSWAVLDPRRHAMTIWEKDRKDFLEAALARNASAITNGPFLKYHKDRNKYQAWLGYQLQSLLGKFCFGISRLLPGVNSSAQQAIGVIAQVYDELLQQKYFSSQKSEGFIFGTAESIRHNDKDESRPQASYFGKTQGRLFADYTIGRGDAPQIAEVIGGLFQSVEDYSPVDTGSASQVGTWGLAPILGATPQCDSLKEAGLDDALDEYEEFARNPGPDGVSHGTGVKDSDACTGLIVALFGGGSPNRFASILSQVLVKEAVRVDGNDSILLASGSTPLQGGSMPYYKKTYNRYGYQFKEG